MKHAVYLISFLHKSFDKNTINIQSMKIESVRNKINWGKPWSTHETERKATK